jgi:putative ABC transport system permease protein
LKARALVYFYRRRLRAHAVQELLAGVGVALGVALVLATLLAAASLAGSADEVVRAVIGPATLQLHARGPNGIDGRLLARVERLPGVRQAAPLLEQTATLTGPMGRTATVDLAGADTSLVVLDGLAHTLPRATLQAGGLGLSRATAAALGIAVPARPGAPASAGPADAAADGPAGAGGSASAGGGVGGGAGGPAAVVLRLRGRAIPLRVSAVLGPETFGALAQARVAVMPLEELQRLAGLRGRVSRILVQPRPGREAQVRDRLATVAKKRADVAPADQDVQLLRQALRPSDQASSFFAAIAGLLGLMLAFNALLLTVPERRRAVADLRLSGARRGAIVQMFAFQAACLGLVASLVGVVGGWALGGGALRPSTAYLAEAFTIGARARLGAGPALLALAAGIAATFLASTVPLLDLRRNRALDAVYREHALPGNALSPRARRDLLCAAAPLALAATVLYAAAPGLALAACALLALATVLTVPLAFAGVLRAGHALAHRNERLTLLTLALGSLRATTLRSLALAATGAVALFGSVALGGARGDLLRGIGGFARAYSTDAPIWVGTPGDNQAVVAFTAPGASTPPRGSAGQAPTPSPGLAASLSHLPGVGRVAAFHGGFVQMAGRRVWLLARPPGGAARVLASQLVAGDATVAQRRLAEGGWVVASAQLATALHVRIGQPLTLPTPAGVAHPRLAATITNLAWSPGALLLGDADYRRLWGGAPDPTALAVYPAPGADPGAALARVRAALAGAALAGSGLVAVSADERERAIDALTAQGLGQLGEIADLLLAVAILALAAALASAMWQRRTALAGLRLAGVRPRRLRAMLLIEAGLMLSAGCLTGALAGVYGELTIDRYLQHVTGFPVAGVGASLRPLELLALIAASALALVAVPAWQASRVPATLAFNE